MANMLALILILCTLISQSASAYEVHEDKSCIEGVQFEINRVRKLILEGKEATQYGNWQHQQMNIGERDLDRSWGDWVKEDITHITGGPGSWIYYTRIREWEVAVQIGLKHFISARLKVGQDCVRGPITVGYVKDELRRPIISQLNYQFRSFEQRFEVTKEYWQNLNTNSQSVINSNICHPVNHQCLESEDKLFLGKYLVSRPCWKQQVTYSCKTEPLDGCKELIARGCHLYNSVCHHKLENICLQWRRHYLCVTEGTSPQEEPRNKAISPEKDRAEDNNPIPFRVTQKDQSAEGLMDLPKQKLNFENNDHSRSPDDQTNPNRKGLLASHEFTFQKYKSYSPNISDTSSLSTRPRNASTSTKDRVSQQAEYGTEDNSPIPFRSTKGEKTSYKSLSSGKQKLNSENSGNSRSPDDQTNPNRKGGLTSHEPTFQKYKSISTNTGSTTSSNANTGSSSTKGASTTAKGSISKEAKNNIVVAESINIDPNFLISEGTYIPCSLTVRFVSDVAGSIQCVISQDVYSSSGNVKLIERGTKAIGVYQSGILQHGLARMFVIWTKLITPDYKRINLSDTQVVGPLGEAGISGRVDSHFLQRFGGALMVSIVKDVLQHMAGRNTKQPRSTININSYSHTKDSFTSIAEKMLENSINIPPTMYKKQGDIVGILVGRDIDFSKIYRLKTR